MEQLTSRFTPPQLITLLRHAGEIWDYSESNVHYLRDLGFTNVRHVPLGYHPELTLAAPSGVEDIDVYFYGGISERRAAILQQLSARCRLHVTQGAEGHVAFGLDRDRLIE